MSGAGCLTVANHPSYPCITVSMESARMTAKMVVQPSREGIDAGTEFQALGLDGSGQVASWAWMLASWPSIRALSPPIRESRRAPRASILVPR